MAITLRVDPYCENCADFEPETRVGTLYCSDPGTDYILNQYGTNQLRSTEVVCKYRQRCWQMYKRLKESINKGETA